MMKAKSYVKIGVLCGLWYASSSFNNLIGKSLLTRFEYPMTLTLVQLVSISVYSEPLLRLTYRYTTRKVIPTNIFKNIILPLAIGKFIASVFSHVSIWKVPVSYAHTVKATMPFFTVVLSRIIFNERHSTQTYISLVPIIGGVILASLNEFNFNFTGLFSALTATIGFSIQNIYSKHVLKITGLHPFELLSQLARLSLLLYLPFWALIDLRSYYTTPTDLTGVNTDSILILLFLDGLLNFLQNILAFSVLKLVSPLTYAVANATKRIFIILVSLLFFGNHVNLANFTGIFITITGVFLYNKAKVQEKNRNKLPFNNI